MMVLDHSAVPAVVLVVEDDPMIGRAVVAGLQEQGFAVDWVRDGGEAELALSHEVYDVALLDPASGKLLDKRGFDTYANPYEADRLAEYLAAIPAGRLVAVATRGDAGRSLTDRAVAALRTIGATIDLRPHPGAAQVILGVKGATPGSAAVAAALKDAHEVVLADHSISWDLVPTVEAHIAAGGGFTMLDHHKSAIGLATHPWATVDLARSGAGLLYDFVGRPPAVADFAALVGVSKFSLYTWKKKFEESQAVYATSRGMMLALVGGGFLIGMSLGYLIARAIARPLAQAVEVLKSVAQRDFTVQLRVDTKDEVGQMATALNETIERIRTTRRDHLAVLGRKAARWVADHKFALTDSDPELPDSLGDRKQDNWRPLIAIADAIGGESGAKARSTAVALSTIAGVAGVRADRRVGDR